MNTCKCRTAGSSQTVVKDDRSLVTENPAGLVPIEEEPLIGETPIDTLQSWLTPNSLFYVRNHYPDPGMNDTSWSLKIDGCVESEQSLVQNDFRSLPKQTLPVMLECAGNNRSDLDPRVPGNPFQNGAVSNAIWSGVPLHMVLEKAGIHPDAIEVLFEGCDEGFGEPGKDKEPYLRSLPIDVAMHPHTLLAYEMNGEPIPHEHGYPIRLVVPGWYGMASVKWLRKMTLINYKYEGFFQTDRYIIEENDGSVTPVAEMSVKSLIGWPQQGATVPPGVYNVTGLAWSGHAHIKRVQVSDDDGASWKDANLVGPRYRYSWQQWNCEWDANSSGHYTLKARAEDEEGNWQPLETKWNRLGYIINGVKPVCVNVSEA